MSRTKEMIVEVEKMTYEEIEKQLAELLSDTADIEAQIRKAKAKVIEKKEYSDPQWFAKATNALKMKRYLIMLMQQRRKKLKKEKSDKETIDFERSFMKIAKRLLTEDTYNMLIEETKVDLSL